MKIKASNLKNHLGNVDLYISSSGFEQRSTAVGTTLDPKGVKNAIIYHIEGTYQSSTENLKKIQENLPDLVTVEYQKNNPLGVFDLFYQTFEKFKLKQYSFVKFKVVVDITTFTREVLLILIKIISLKDFVNQFDVTLLYTPAESYCNSSEDLWLTKGVRDIRSVLGYSGMPSPSKKLMLVVLNGFEEDRTSEIIDSFEPNMLVLGKPSKSSAINDNLNTISFEKFTHIIEKYQSIIAEQFEFSCSEILETTNILDAIIEKYQGDYNIVIAPLNNKVSTLGVAIAALKNECVQICYASANQYNIDSYSQKCDYFLMFDFNELVMKKTSKCI